MLAPPAPAAGHLDFRRPTHLWLFVGVCGLLAPAVACMSFVMLSRGFPIASETRLVWSMSDALGYLVLVPPLVLLSPSLRMRPPPMRRLASNAAALTVLSGVVALVFLNSHTPFLFVIPPLLVVLAFQMEVVGAALGVLVTAVDRRRSW